jgi:gliding motility-associated-like protein
MLIAQNEANVWYFGNHAGIDFGFIPPQTLTNPNMATLEGCSSIADSSGTILFYTDGRTVWNKRDNIMPNGVGLKGNASSTHSSVIVKKPLSPGEYYIITADEGAGSGAPGSPNEGVNYSLVNMDLNFGLGAVTSKNIPLVNISAEKIAVTRHKNDVYAWIAIPQGRSRAIYMYLVTENGIEFKYADSSFLGTQIESYGQIKFSSDGKHLALLSQSNAVTVFDFDNLTGALHKSQTISGGNEVYGIEFSPSGKFIYLSTWFTQHRLCQCEVKNGITDYTNDCRFYSAPNVSGQLQLAPNQQIYVTNNSFNYLSTISNPDSAFNESGYIDTAIMLPPGTSCALGLPTFHSGYLNLDPIKLNDICQYETAYYYFNTSKISYDSLRWFVNGQPTSDTTGSGKSWFDIPGLYPISIVYYKNNLATSFSRTLTIRALPVKPNFVDTSVCIGDLFICNAYRQPGTFYLWNTGDTTASITARHPGEYSVLLTRNRCSISDSFNLQHNPYPVVNIPDETILCLGSMMNISAEFPGASYLWSTGEISSSVLIGNPQLYWVTVTKDRCTTRDSFNLVTTTLPDPHLGDDTTLCTDQAFQLNITWPYSTYIWNTGFTQPVIDIKEPGTYIAEVTNPCGTVADTIEISQQECNCHVWTPNSFTPNGDHTNDLFIPVISCDYTVFDFRIFNRWGQEVFRSDSPAKAWSGLFNNETMPADVFTWKLTCTMVNSAGKPFEENVKGTVTLIR